MTLARASRSGLRLRVRPSFPAPENPQAGARYDDRVSDPSILESLAAVPHFGALGHDVLRRIVEICRLVTLGAGETLFVAGERARAFYVVRRGAIRAYQIAVDGREQVMHSLRPGQSFAEHAAFGAGRYPVHAQAKSTPTEVIEIGAQPFLRLVTEEPAIAAAVIAALSQRLMTLVERVEELSLASAEARLARYLLRQPSRPLARSGASGSTCHRIDLQVAKKDLAAEIGVTPETLSRTLRRWREGGILESQGRQVLVHDAVALERAAGEHVE